jgi:condensin complex subunit 1
VDSPENIMDTRVLDVYRSFLKHFERLSGPVSSKMIDSICSTLQTELDTTSRDIEVDALDSLPAHKQSLEQLVFLLNWFVMAAEKSASKSVTVEKPKRGKATKKKTQSDEWKWEDQVLPTLNVINKVLKLKTHRLWTTTPERDAFIK